MSKNPLIDLLLADPNVAESFKTIFSPEEMAAIERKDAEDAAIDAEEAQARQAAKDQKADDEWACIQRSYRERL